MKAADGLRLKKEKCGKLKRRKAERAAHQTMNSKTLTSEKKLEKSHPDIRLRE